MNKINYQKLLDKELEKIKNTNSVPTLLLQSCCAPCSSYVLEYLSDYFCITVFFYNPNIETEKEYLKRKDEQIRLIASLNTKHPIDFLDCDYNPEEFYSSVKGLENEKEGGKRCFTCYELRIQKTAEMAKINNLEYFCTTLTISPLKNSKKINEIGENLEKQYKIKFLKSDFKKKEGYKRSVELSKLYNLYRQNYCGCIFSKTEGN